MSQQPSAVESAPATTPPDPSDTTWGYRPALDGLRTVAVYIVVAFHAGVVAFAGGFIGVDLFFVLSGFLVTSVLLAEYAQRGRIDLGRFYARRVRRLLPAAIVTIVTIAAVSVLIEPPLTRSGHVADARSALLYVSNWHFIGEATDYFAQDVHSSPYLHFWSLSVEEQFYVAFPLVLIGLLALARRWSRPGLGVVVLAVVLAIGVATQLYWADRDPLQAYYGTGARVYQMITGALLALVLTQATARRIVTRAKPAVRTLAGAVAAVALAVLVLAATDLISWSVSHRGFVAAAMSVVVIGSLELAGPSPMAWVLARPPLVYLGRISYGTYLWHWPIIVFASQILDLGPVALMVASAVGATALSSLSYALLETPVRTARSLRRYSWPVVATGLAASVLAALLIAPTILGSDRRPVVSASGAPGAGGASAAALLPATTVTPTTSIGAANDPPQPSAPASASASTSAEVPITEMTVPSAIDLAAAASYTTGQFTCDDATPEDCTLVRGTGPHVFLLGDSNAAAMVPMFRQLAEDRGFTFSATTAAGCTWQDGLGWQVDDRTLLDDCVATRNDVYDRVLPALRPDVVVTVHVSRDDPARPSPPFIPLDSSLGTGAEAFAAATSISLDRLDALGVRVLLVEPVPYSSFDTVQCLSGVELVIDCSFEASPQPSPAEIVYRYEALERPGVYDVDFDPLVCPLDPLCMPIIDGELVFRDALHVYPPYMIDHRDEYWALMEQTGVFT